MLLGQWCRPLAGIHRFPRLNIASHQLCVRLFVDVGHGYFGIPTVVQQQQILPADFQCLNYRIEPTR